MFDLITRTCSLHEFVMLSLTNQSVAGMCSFHQKMFSLRKPHDL